MFYLSMALSDSDFEEDVYSNSDYPILQKESLFQEPQQSGFHQNTLRPPQDRKLDWNMTLWKADCFDSYLANNDRLFSSQPSTTENRMFGPHYPDPSQERIYKSMGASLNNTHKNWPIKEEELSDSGFSEMGDGMEYFNTNGDPRGGTNNDMRSDESFPLRDVTNTEISQALYAREYNLRPRKKNQLYPQQRKRKRIAFKKESNTTQGPNQKAKKIGRRKKATTTTTSRRVDPQIATISTQMPEEDLVLEVGPDPIANVKGFSLIPPLVLRFRDSYEPSYLDWIRVELLEPLEKPYWAGNNVFLSGVGVKANLCTSREHHKRLEMSCLKVTKELAPGKTKGYNFKLRFTLMRAQNELHQVVSDTFLLWSNVCAKGFPRMRRSRVLVERAKKKYLYYHPHHTGDTGGSQDTQEHTSD